MTYVKTERKNQLKNLLNEMFLQDIPWSYLEENPDTKEMEWKGYCVDLAKQLAEMMNFDYEFSKPQNGRYGEKMKNGKWNGLVGDLARGVSSIIFQNIGFLVKYTKTGLPHT